jgi:hypothetical protein
LSPKRPIDNIQDPSFDQTVCRNDDSADAVVSYEGVNNLRNVSTQRGLTTRKPQVSDLRHCLRDLLNLFEGHVAWVIQLFVIEAGFTEGVAARRHKEE